MPDQTPEPDEFGRYRVTDKDTGHKRSIPASELPHGNYTVLKAPASNPHTGEPLPPELKEHKSTGTATPAPAGAGLTGAPTPKEGSDG